jgi:glyoxylate/hydroxypyruvate reductase A
LFYSTWENAAEWRSALADALGGEAVESLESGDAKADVAVVWNAPKTAFHRAPWLKLVCSLGAGVDHLVSLSDVLPESIRYSRMVDPVMANRMALHVLAVILRKHRNLDLFEDQQRAGTWQRKFHSDVGDTTVAVLGQGTLGGAVSATLAAIGFNVIGWARSARQTAAWPVLSGESGLVKALADAAFVVAVLPLTAETKGLLSAALFSRMRRGAYLINVGRGEHLVEADLLAAIDSKHLSGAALDAFTIEPLPLESPLWAHLDIFITPHVASLSNPATGAMAIAKEIEAFRMNGALEYEVDCRRQY